MIALLLTLDIASFLPPSRMVMPERNSVNALFINTNNNSQKPSTGMAMDMEVDIPRGQSASSSTNSSRASSTHSNVSSTEYAECIQVFANNPTWVEQVKLSELQEPTLFYMSPKVGEMEPANQANAMEFTPVLHGATSNDMCTPQGAILQLTNVNMCESQELEPSTIPYTVNQLADLQLWDSSFCPISIFGINNYLKGDAKNIIYLLY